MPILLTNEDVKRLITPEIAVEVMKETYRSIAGGTAVTRTRSQTFAETSREGVFVELRTMDGIVPSLSAVGMRILPDLHSWPKVGENLRYDKIPKKNGRFLAFDLIFDLDTADLQAVIQDAYLQQMRIAGAHGVAAEYLARRDASRVGVIGSGWLARGVLSGISVVRSLRSIKVFSPTAANRVEFAKDAERELNVKATAVETPESAVQDVDIIVVCTNTIDPVFFGKWLSPSVHLDSISGRDIDDESFRRSDYTVLSMREGKCNEGLNFFPRLLRDKLAARFSPFTRPIRWETYPELGEVIIGKARGRNREDEITFFCNNVGFGAQFAALGGKAVALAKERGMGKPFSIDEWYEEVR
ncbi:MAG: ornithine cyclodeaminase family protein [Deltaproteobacteria bacterium]|nr:ornithine cyclodeaminase family protein [Deltaproteobacteria bacterium]